MKPVLERIVELKNENMGLGQIQRALKNDGYRSTSGRAVSRTMVHYYLAKASKALTPVSAAPAAALTIAPHAEDMLSGIRSVLNLQIPVEKKMRAITALVS